MNRTENVRNKKKITILVLALLLLIISLGTYFTVQVVNARTIDEQLKIGNKFYEEQKYEEAIIAYEQVLDIDPKNTEARIGIAKSYVALEKHVKAVEVLVAGIKIVPKSASLYLELSDVKLMQEDILGAIESLDEGFGVTNDSKIKEQLKEIDEDLILVSDRDKVQIGKTAELKVLYTKQNDNSSKEKEQEKEKEQNANESNEESDNQPASNDTTDSTKDTSEETVEKDEVENITTDANSTEETSKNGDSVQNTEDVKDEQSIVVHAKWSLGKDELAELSEKESDVNTLLAKKAGQETVTAQIGSIKKTVAISIQEHVLESLEVIATKNKTTIGQEIGLKAIGKDADGKEMAINPVWYIEEGTGTLAKASGAENTFVSNENGESTIIAKIDGKEFKIKLQVEDNNYTLTKLVEGQGSIISSPTGTTFKEGDSVLLKAVADEGWEFVGWDSTIKTNSAEVSIVMDNDKSIKAKFKQKPKYYTLNLTKKGEGTIKTSSDSTSIKEGTTVEITATPAAGWEFDHWEGSISGNQRDTKVKMNGSKQIKAVFVEIEEKQPEDEPKEEEPQEDEPKEEPVIVPVDNETPKEPKYYTLETSVAGQGSIGKAVSNNKYEQDSLVELTANAADGWGFDHWEVDGVNAGQSTKLSVKMNSNKHIKAVFVQYGSIIGMISDAKTGKEVPEVNIKLRTGLDNHSSNPILVTKTNNDGNYSFANIFPGEYTMEISLNEYTTKFINVVVETGTVVKKNESIMPFETEISDFVVVLSWNDLPRDLDAHLTGPKLNSTERFHIFYNNEIYEENGVKYAELDVDDVNGYGPETITSFKQVDGVYRFFVNNYSLDAPLVKSGAKVELYKDGNLIKVFNIPTSGEGEYWNVFEINNGILTTINQISSQSME